jgi:uncharacterized protein (DUF2249 family)
MTTNYVDLDVRPILMAGGEPFAAIMEAVGELDPGEGLRLLATFEPTPLFSVLGARGFEHEASELGGGDWQVLFTPTVAPTADAPSLPKAPTDAADWPEPARHLDTRELDPPEPMVRILAEVEAMPRGEVLVALLNREPVFLLPELAKRGHPWRGGFEPDGDTYRLVVLVGLDGEAKS